MLKPGMPQPGMQSMPYPQPAAPQAPLPQYLQALFPNGLPSVAVPSAGQAAQAVPGQMQSPQLQDLGQMQPMPFQQPMSQMSPPPYLQALLGGLPQGAMGLPMQAMQNAPGMMPAPLDAASMAPQSSPLRPFRPFPFLGTPSRVMSYR